MFGRKETFYLYFLFFKGGGPCLPARETKLQNVLLYPAILYLNELSDEVHCSQCIYECIAKEDTTVVETDHKL